MPKKVEEKRPKSKKLAITLRSEMTKSGLTLRELEAKTRLNYEHLRRIFNGDAHPSSYELESICKIMNLPADEMDSLSTADQIFNDYGIEVGLEALRTAAKPVAASAVPPDLTLLASDWEALTPGQQASFRVQIQAVAEYNRKHKGKK